MRRSGACIAFVLWAGLLQAAEPRTPRPDDARAAEQHYRSGLERMQAESWSEAAREFEQAVALDPYMVMGHYNLGQCQMALKDYAQAQRAYGAARDAFQQLGSLSEKERNRRERERRDEMNELRDSLARAHTLKNVNVQQITMRIEERMRVLESMELKGAERREMPAEIPLALGSAYFRQGLLPDAEREYKDALRINKKLGAAHNNLAVIYMMTKRLEEADAEAQEAEKAGFAVSPRFKDDLKKARQAASSAQSPPN
jgi:Tfp pilus assembly protein PilF